MNPAVMQLDERAVPGLLMIGHPHNHPRHHKHHKPAIVRAGPTATPIPAPVDTWEGASWQSRDINVELGPNLTPAEIDAVFAGVAAFNALPDGLRLHLVAGPVTNGIEIEDGTATLPANVLGETYVTANTGYFPTDVPMLIQLNGGLYGAGYDAQTNVEHELGHAVGLGHDETYYGINSDGYDVMYPFRGPGITRYAYSQNDVRQLEIHYGYA